MFATTLKGIKDTAEALGKINEIAKFDGIASKTSQFKKLEEVLKGVEKQQALLSISTSNLSDADKKNLAIKLGLVTATEADAMATTTDTVAKYANLKVSNLLRVAWAKLSAFAKVNPYLLIASAVAAATVAIYKYSKADEEALENSKERLNEISSEYKNVTSEVESLQDKVSELDKQISQLDPITDDTKIQKLKEERAEIAQEVALLKEKQALLAEEEAKEAEKTLTQTISSKYSNDDYLQNVASTTTGDVAGDAGRVLGYLISNQGLTDQVTEYEELSLAMEEVNRLEAQRAELEKKSAEAIQNKNYEENKVIESQITDLNSQISEVETHTNTLASSVQGSFTKLKDGDLKNYIGELLVKYFEFSENIDVATASFKALNQEQQKNILISKLSEEGLSDYTIGHIFNNINPEDYENLYNVDFTPPALTDYDTAEEYGKAYAQAWLNGIKLETTEPETPQYDVKWTGSFSEDQSKLIDEFQSKIQSLGDTLSSIQSGEDISFTDLVQEFPELQGKAENLEEAIKLLIQEAWQELQTTMGEGLPSDVKDDLQDTVDDILNTTKTLEDYVDQLSQVKSAYDICLSTKEEYDEQGYLSIETLEKVLSLGNDYLQYLFDEQGNVELDAEAFRKLSLARLNDLEMQALNDLAKNIQLIKDEQTATEHLATKQNELASSYGDVAANALMAMTTISGFSDSEALQGAYESFKAQYNQIKGLFASARKGLDDTYTSTSETALKEAQQATKDYITSYMNFQKASLDKGVIDYKAYCDNVSSMLKKMYDDGKISAQDYHSYVKEMLEVQQDAMDKVISAVTYRLDKEIKSYEKQIDQIEERYNSEIEYLDTVIEYYKDQKKALQDTNDELDRQKALEEALYKFHQAQTQRTQRVYTGSKGVIYNVDSSAIKEASEDLRKAQLDIELAKLDDAIEQIELQQETLEEAMKKETEQLQEIIDKLSDYRDKWEEVAKEYEILQNELLAEQMLGADWEQKILDGRADVLNDFKAEYISIQQAIADAAWASANAQIEAINAVRRATEAGVSSGGDSNTPSINNDNSKYEVVYEDGAETVKTFDTEQEAQDFADKMSEGIPDDEPSYYVKKYHTGLDEGYVGDKTSLSDDKRLKVLQKAGNGLLPNEVRTILEKGEVVLTKPQQINIADALLQRSIMPNITIPDYSHLNNVVSRNNTQSITLSIGDIHLSGVQDANSLARDIVAKLPNRLMQEIYRN